MARIRALLMMTVVLAACSGGGTSPSPAPTSPSPPAPAAPPATSAPVELRGIWGAILPEDRGGAFPLAGAAVSLTLTENTYDIVVPIDRIIGTIVVRGDQIEFSEPSSGCLGKATYLWSLNCDSLTLTRLGAEPCIGRNQVLNGVTFTRRSATP
jgi:hypothetical protein